MLPFINLFGFPLPTYGIFVSLGAMVGMAVALLFCIKRRLDFQKCIIVMALSLGAGLLGAKLLSIFTIYSPQRIIKLLLSSPLRLITDSGLVFFGGIIFAVPFVFLVSRLVRFDLAACEDILVAAIAIGHSFGRVGCFLAGCCYGCESEAFGVVYTDPDCFAPTGIPLFPIQLVEALFELALFALFLFLCLKGKKKRLCLPIYLIAYPAFRFFAEFFRADAERGFWLGISTSQWISFVALAVGVLIFILRTKNQKSIDINKKA